MSYQCLIRHCSNEIPLLLLLFFFLPRREKADLISPKVGIIVGKFCYLLALLVENNWLV